MSLPEERYTPLLGSDESVSGRFEPPLVNIGVGSDLTIAELAEQVRRVVGFEGGVVYDRSKPDGTPRKLMDVSRLSAAGWTARTPLDTGLRTAYSEFVRSLG
jgi:GDP-L-fucose synthase